MSQEYYQNEPQAVSRDPRAEPRPAENRAQTPNNGERLTRRRRVDDALSVEGRKIPGNMSYNWKRETIGGKPDVSHQINMRENHWRPVPISRHPELVVPGEDVVRRGDVILMERPSYLTEEAQLEDMQEALDPVQKMEEMMYGSEPGHFSRDHPSVKKQSYIKQQYAPGERPRGEQSGDSDGLSSEP